MDVEVVPEQPAEVAEAVSGLLEEGRPGGGRVPDPWWQAGIDEALDP